MDLIDEYLTKNGYSNFAYNKNKYDAVFVTGSDFTTMKVNSDRRLTIKPELYITEDYFNGGFIVDSLLFRMELKDTSSQDERYNLTADKLTIKSGSDTLTVTSDIICSSDFESSYYLSRFDYSLSSDDLAKLSQMLDSGTLAFEIKAKNAISDYSTIPAKTTYETVSITYNFKESDISSLKQTLEIYDYLSSVL